MEPSQVTNINERPGEDLVFRDTSKKSKGMIVGMVVLALLATGGIGFGVWAMMNGNAKVEQLNSQVDSLKRQNSELQDKVNNSGDIAPSGGASEGVVNPIIQNQDSEILDRVSFVSVGNPRIRVILDKGDLSECSFESDEDRDNDWDVKECDLGDLGGKVYKVVSFGGTQELDPYIGFIMTDGTVKYLSFYDVINSGNYTLRTLVLDGKVIDIVKIISGQKGATAGGYITNVFVLNDGTVVRFDESMVTQ